MRWGIAGIAIFLSGCVSVTIEDPRSHDVELYPELVDLNQSGHLLEYRWQIDSRPSMERFFSIGNSRYSYGEQDFRVWEYKPSYTSTGLATWRDERFDNHVTVAGELFDNDGLQAAHKFLRIPCWIEVTNLKNQKKAIVRVNDRGPFHGNYDIDLSRGAAEKLGFGDRLAMPVHIKLIENPRDLYIETNMVYGEEAAQELLANVSKIHNLPTKIMPHEYENRFRVEIGPLSSLDDGRWIQRWLLVNLNMESTLLSY